MPESIKFVYTGSLNLRCFMYPGALHPVDRYIDGLLALRAEREPHAEERQAPGAARGRARPHQASPLDEPVDEAGLADARSREQQCQALGQHQVGAVMAKALGAEVVRHPTERDFL